MGVYIENMKPCVWCCTAHDACNLFDSDGVHYWCRATKLQVFPPFDVPKHCPLIEVPDGHGRLIDADALIAEHQQVCSRSMKFNLDLAPTIIPADKEE